MTTIEWTHREGTTGVTWNPVTGCTPISEGCAHCYAERMAKRLAGRFGYPADDPFRVTLHPDKMRQPYSWRKPRTVFVCSMGDLFHEDVGYNWHEAIWDVMEATPQHTYLILTKRPEHMEQTLDTLQVSHGILNNVWLGVTAENQRRADERIPLLLRCPAAVRFVSIEPMLGPIHFRLPDFSDYGHGEGWLGNTGSARKQPAGVTWVIVGGESGPGARPMHPDWARGVRDQCKAAGVPFFFKQWGEFKYAQYDASWRVHRWANDPASVCSMVWERDRDQMIGDFRAYKVGKKHSGWMLDGHEHHEWPTP